jgi:hypothetical protein
VRFRFISFRPPHAEPARERQLSLIDFGFQLQTEALDLLLQNDASRSVQAHDPKTRDLIFEVRLRRQTACYWQF